MAALVAFEPRAAALVLEEEVREAVLGSLSGALGARPPVAQTTLPPLATQPPLALSSHHPPTHVVLCSTCPGKELGGSQTCCTGEGFSPLRTAPGAPCLASRGTCQLSFTSDGGASGTHGIGCAGRKRVREGGAAGAGRVGDPWACC